MKINSHDGQFLIATHDYKQNQTIISLGAKKTTEDDNRRIQINETDYILPPHLLYHACEPNAYIDWKDMTLKAMRPILKGVTVTYHYGTSEYDYSIGAFTCDCGSKHCIGHFSGFCNMTHEQKARVIQNASPYIRKIYFSEN